MKPADLDDSPGQGAAPRRRWQRLAHLPQRAQFLLFAAVAVLVAAGAGHALLGWLGCGAPWTGALIGALAALGVMALLGLLARFGSVRWIALAGRPDAHADGVVGDGAIQAASRDALTGAYTQAFFVAAADREWARLRRLGEDAALLMVDVDRFQALNDAHGRACGDAMLLEVTRQTCTTLRPYDLLARFDGGVLVNYLPHTDPLGALDVAERIRERVAALRLAWNGRAVGATVSVGAATIGAAHDSIESVIAEAGAALREAKAAGRNCVRTAPTPPRRSGETTPVISR